jgi:pimeloyl-ACP methyl ester carboxylesterase
MNPSGDKIQLAVIRHKASKPDQRIGSILFNPRGPGDTGVGAVKGAADDLDAWGNGRFDIVSWDPRGTYGSSPIRCFTDDASEAAFWKDAKVPYTQETSVAYRQRVLDLAQRCGEVMGPLLSHVSTADTARDIDALRAGLGEDKITYVGLSYGTVLGQAYLNMFPQHVRAMMLDSVVAACRIRRAPRTGSGTGTPRTRSTTSSRSCATRPGPPSASSPATRGRPRRSAWTSYSRSSAPAPSPRPMRTRPASSTTATPSTPSAR